MPNRCAAALLEQPGRKVDYISMRAAAEAVEVVAVELQARRPVRVERAAHEAMLNRPIAPRRLDGRHRSFDFVVVDSFYLLFQNIKRAPALRQTLTSSG